MKNEHLEDAASKALLKDYVLTLLASRKRTEATELIVKWIQGEKLDGQKRQTKKYIYTIRSDEKPEIWIYKEGIYVPEGKTFIQQICRDILNEAYTTSFANQVISKIQTDTFIEAKNFFENKHIEYVPVQNGLLNIFTKKITKFDPKKIFFNKLPITFDKNARCQNIIKHFKTVLKDTDDAMVMFELFGFLLIRDYKFEKAVMFIGDGRNGKGKTLELIKTFLSPENCSSIPLQQIEKDAYSIGELQNKLANISGDLSPTALNETGRFKELTGKDFISAQRKFLTRLQFVNYAKLFFSCNKLPKSKDTTNAFWERWLLFEFPYTFKTQNEINKINEKDKKNFRLKDINILEKLTTKKELSGLLNIVLDGLKNITKNKKFSYSKGTEDVKNMWIRKSDSFLAFGLDCLEADFDCKIEKPTLSKAYAEYCKKHKLSIQSQKSISETINEVLQDLLQTPITTWQEGSTGNRYWSGIRFKKGEIIEDLNSKISHNKITSDMNP
ncbi:MAG: phage/plasmid primase, P4 family [Sphaerochaetaceae bacterium]|nr:phage/plasmid primase, P4 family [Sphaerochaetaceae bacterium]